LKFTIVTPSFNSERFIAETIQSVIGQFGDFYIEYIIMDGCSTDRTPEIVREFQERLNSDRFKVNCAGIELKYFSMKDDGMYDAINKGFRMGTGEIFAWLNSDDIYLPGALSIIQKCFEKYDSVQWLKGKSTYINEMSAIYQPCRHFVYARTWLASGYYGPVAPFVEQESVFWRANLWPRVGDEIAQYKLAGDFKAWILMSRECRLYCLDAFVSCFRRVKGQKSQDIRHIGGRCVKRFRIRAGESSLSRS